MTTLILKPTYIIPVVPENTVYDDHAILIHDDTIEKITPVDAITQTDDIPCITLENTAIMPGLINTHTHSPMTLLRGLADDLPLMTWLNDHIWPAEGKWLGQEFIADGTQLAIAEMIKGGTTCFNEHYFQANVLADVAHKTGMRANIGLWLGDLPVLDGKNIDEQLKTAEAVLASHGNLSPLISMTMAPHSPYLLDDSSLIKLKDFAKTHQLGVHMHVHESQNEMETSMQQHQKRPLARMQALGLLSDRFQCVHMTQVNDEDLRIMTDTGAHAITCPHSNLKLASGMCPVHQLLEKDINVAIGTDGAASNNDLDMLSEMQTTALLTKALAQDPTAVPAHQALTMATINGAKALGMEASIGSLEAGKQADMMAINLNHVSTQPLYNVISQVVYAASRDQVSHVWVAGKCLMEKGKLSTIDEADALNKARSWRDKIINTQTSQPSTS
jgi:5-methylthioadenosine/S-adenosylhomocysteine deaminase